MPAADEGHDPRNVSAPRRQSRSSLTIVTSVIMLIPTGSAQGIDRGGADRHAARRHDRAQLVRLQRRHGDDGLRDLEVPGQARRRVRRRADPRQHPARDHLDPDPDDHRALRRRLLDDRPRRHRGQGIADPIRSTSPPSSSPGASTTPSRARPRPSSTCPSGTQLELHLHALDVLHSFWVPEWRIKRDLVPGPRHRRRRRRSTTPSSRDARQVEGIYSVVCTELCGSGHSTMRAAAVGRDPGGVRRLGSREQKEHPGGRGRAPARQAAAGPAASPTAVDGLQEVGLCQQHSSNPAGHERCSAR